MKKFPLNIWIAAALLIAVTTLNAKVVTLTIDTSSGATKATDEATIGTNEVATVLSWPRDGIPTTQLEIVKSGSVVRLTGGDVPGLVPVVVAGPATIRLLSNNQQIRQFCTIEIAPESFPPDKTIIIPADTKGANIIMESSTNLIQWTTASPGVYTNLTGHMFF